MLRFIGFIVVILAFIAFAIYRQLNADCADTITRNETVGAYHLWLSIGKTCP